MDARLAAMLAVLLSPFVATVVIFVAAATAYVAHRERPYRHAADVEAARDELRRAAFGERT